LFPSPAINPVAELQLTAITNRRPHRHHIPESLSESRKIPTRFAEDPFMESTAPSLPAQGDQRPSFYFNICRGNPSQERYRVLSRWLGDALATRIFVVSLAVIKRTIAGRRLILKEDQMERDSRRRIRRPSRGRSRR